jgi:hypothetical protein
MLQGRFSRGWSLHRLSLSACHVAAEALSVAPLKLISRGPQCSLVFTKASSAFLGAREARRAPPTAWPRAAVLANPPAPGRPDHHDLHHPVLSARPSSTSERLQRGPVKFWREEVAHSFPPSFVESLTWPGNLYPYNHGDFRTHCVCDGKAIATVRRTSSSPHPAPQFLMAARLGLRARAWASLAPMGRRWATGGPRRGFASKTGRSTQGRNCCMDWRGRR